MDLRTIYRRSWIAATRQLGNAVPTIVGEYMARAVKKFINGKRK
jgi:site-specific DNA-cytosine methylase